MLGENGWGLLAGNHFLLSNICRCLQVFVLLGFMRLGRVTEMVNVRMVTYDCGVRVFCAKQAFVLNMLYEIWLSWSRVGTGSATSVTATADHQVKQPTF